MLTPEQAEAFESFREKARGTELLNEREKLFVQFAAAISLGCQP